MSQPIYLTWCAIARWWTSNQCSSSFPANYSNSVTHTWSDSSSFNPIILFLQGPWKTHLMACIVHVSQVFVHLNCCMSLRMATLYPLQLPTVPMVVFVLLEDWIRLRGGWRYVCKEGGVVCVGQIGTIRMRLLCADNWATLQQVCKWEGCCWPSQFTLPCQRMSNWELFVMPLFM